MKIGEQLEVREELSQEMQELDEITNEPESYIESKVDLAQSEAIESSFNELVNTAQEQVENLAEAIPEPIHDEGPEGTTEAEPVENLAEIMPLPMPKEGPVDTQAPAGAEDELAVTMPALPPDGSEMGETVGQKWPGQETEQVSAVYDGSSFSVQASAEAKPDTGETSTRTGETSGDTTPGDTVVTPINIPEEPSPDDSSPDLIGENG